MGAGRVATVGAALPVHSAGPPGSSHALIPRPSRGPSKQRDRATSSRDSNDAAPGLEDRSISTIPIITGVRQLAEQYSGWLCDIWGVIHNGREPHWAAVEACRQHRAAGGRVVLITNAPRPNAPVRTQLERMGVAGDAYDAIVTSGDVTRDLIAGWQGRALYHLGPERDRPIFDGLDVQFSSAEEADVIINTGLFDDRTETPDHYRAQFEEFRARNLPMICANPDLVVERGTELCYCAGALAALYEEMGGKVAYAGKPHPPIYDVCMDHLNSAAGAQMSRARVLAIGDGLKTDMAGALAVGIDALFVPSGVHVETGRTLDPALLTDLFSDQPSQPVAAIAGLKW